MKQYLIEIFFLLGSDRKKIPVLLILFFCISILDLLSLALIAPYISLVIDPESILNTSIGEWIYKFGLPQHQKPLLIVLGIILFSVFLIRTIATIGINYVIIRFSQDQQVRLRSLLMESYQSMTYDDYLKRNSAEYIHSVQNLVTDYTAGVVSIGLRVVSDSIVAIAIFIMLMLTNGPALILLVSLLTVSLFIYDRIFRKKLRDCGIFYNLASTSMVQGINEGIEGLKEVRILGKESFFHRKVYKGAQEVGHYTLVQQIISSSPRYFLELLLIIFIVLFVIGTLLLGHNIDGLIPVLGVFGVAAMRLIPIFNGFSTGLSSLRVSRDAVSRLYNDLSDLMLRKNTSQSKIDTPVEPFRVLSLDQVSFCYENTQALILNKISLNINDGDSIGFIGSSGSGKTTLIDIVLGLLTPKDGLVSYNGKPLSESLSGWRSQVAYLPQNVFLIDDTLRSNIALGIPDTEINDSQLDRSICQAQLSSLVNKLPEGVETRIGERGVRLSGGQRQRIALARAFYHKRTILVMDEATSALDNETEQEIVEEIKKLKGSMTVIIIAHRLTTLRYCNKIYKLKDGKIVSSGDYQEMTSD